jgi:predicted AAA+ superfamily ATPase
LEDWADYYASYLQTYIERDVRDITNVHDMGAFIKFVKSAAALSGEQLNYTTLAEICGMDVNTTKRWVSILETSGLVYILQPYYNNFNKRLTKTPKIYFLETGLLCYLCGWNTPQQLTSGARWGHIFETFAVGEILKSYYNNGVLYPPLYYYRDKEKNEIDLIIEDGATLYPVEIKTSSDPNKNMVNGFEILKNIPDKQTGAGALICPSKKLLPLTGNVMIVPVDMI